MTPNTKRTISIEELIRQDEEANARKIIDPIKTSGTLIPNKEELRDLKKENRFYLPVLHINHMDMWPPKPKSQRKHFTDKMAKEVCLSRCCGVDGLKSACCRLDPDDIEHVLGPLSEDWISSIIKWFKKKGVNVTKQDIAIDFEEGVLIGRKFFNGHRVFEDPKSYPIMRFQVDGPHFSCKFLNNASGMCNIYEQRPDMCRNYLCGFVKSNFLVRTKEHPNQWRMVDVRPDDKQQ